jgi:hypothetical protein
VPTILFEAGHFNQDYQREKTREFIFYSLLSLFDIVGKNLQSINYEEYFNIPENLKNYNDFILRNVKSQDEKKLISVAIQYEEVLKNEQVIFSPIIDAIGKLNNKFGHREEDAKGSEILTNSQEKLTVGTNISEIFDKYDSSIIYFQ